MHLASDWHNACGLLQAAWHLRGATQKAANVRLWGRPLIHNHGRLIIGDRVRLVSTVVPIELTVASGTLEIQDRVFINYGCSIGTRELVRIGQDCAIGSYVMIIDNSFHRLEPERRNELPESAPVILEQNVWLGTRVIVLPGVTIGSGSVVGAGSVVTRDIPPRSLAVGSPARVVRSL
jgi:maltose O-acetyltransferase